MATQRINHEGRILGPAPVVSSSLLFNTPEADAVVSSMQIYPVTNPWNERVDHLPLLPNSDAMIAQINSDVGASHRVLKLFPEMNFCLVPDNQPLVSIEFTEYPDESDLNGGSFPVGRYPIPSNMPIEGWPLETGGETLAQWQADADGSDRHSIIVQPGAGRSWETWMASRSGTSWSAANGAIFHLNTNALRPDTWTSGDAAGFPMFPALVRYDECERGMVEHACRLVVVRTRAAHLYPATHQINGRTSTNYPAMGQRLRLKSGFVAPANWTKQERALVAGLKKYGAMVSDLSSSFFSISITPDDRWPDGAFDHINSSLAVTNFEVVVSTGPNDGPRSPGAPAADAGPDQTVAPGQFVQLKGAVDFTGTPPVIEWKKYSGPGTVTFANAAQTNTTATFSAPGAYTLELSADDTVHAVAYAAVTINVVNGIHLAIARDGADVVLNWTGGTGPFHVQQAASLPATWSDLVITNGASLRLPLTSAASLFRVQAQ